MTQFATMFSGVSASKVGRTVTDDEHDWIVAKCRKGVLSPIGHRIKTIDHRLLAPDIGHSAKQKQGSYYDKMKEGNQSRKCSKNSSSLAKIGTRLI